MEKRTEKVDILNREEFINRTIQLVKLIAANKGNTTFAISGEWGCGKTFVMDKIQNRLDKDTETAFIVIPYNCWQYDYYNEPLVAIVSTLLDCLKKTKKVAKKTRERVAAIAKQLGKAALTVGAHYIEYKTGIDFAKEANAFNDIIDGVDDAVKIDDRAYDANFELRESLEKLKKALADLCKKKTIVFCVDELDRCLPEYAIKVLERLHHISENVPNMITIIAVDKKRLENTVNSIFGNKDDKQDDCADKYLKKFIRFELHLDNGKQDSPKFFDKFPDFYSRFDASLYDRLENTEQFLEELFYDIDIRSQERIIERATIIHDICFGEEKQDHSVMYMELFYVVLYYHYKNNGIFDTHKKLYDQKDIFETAGDVPQTFRSSESGFCFKNARVTNHIDHYELLVDLQNIYAAILLYWYYTPKPDRRLGVERREIIPKYPAKYGEQTRIDSNINKMRAYIDVLKTIA